MAVDGHTDENMLEQYAMGSISEEDSAAVEEHLLVCARCREELERTDAYVKAMQAAAAELRRQAEPRSRFARLMHPGRMSWAVALAAAILVLIVGLGWQARRTSQLHPVEIALAAMRGAGSQAQAPEGLPLRLKLDLGGIPVASSYRVQVVDERGEVVFEGDAAGQRDKAIAVIPPRKAGMYFVRLFSPAAALLREYSLPVGGR